MSLSLSSLFPYDWTGLCLSGRDSADEMPGSRCLLLHGPGFQFIPFLEVVTSTVWLRWYPTGFFKVKTFFETVCMSHCLSDFQLIHLWTCGLLLCSRVFIHPSMPALMLMPRFGKWGPFLCPWTSLRHSCKCWFALWHKMFWVPLVPSLPQT